MTEMECRFCFFLVSLSPVFLGSHAEYNFFSTHNRHHIIDLVTGLPVLQCRSLIVIVIVVIDSV